MTLRRYGNPRDANESEIMGELLKLECRVWRLDFPVDLLVYEPQTRRFIPIEVKMPKQPLTEIQRRFFEACSQDAAAVVHSPAEARAVIEAMRRG